MTSKAKIVANRKNAQRSSGPKTAGGISRAKANATRHGLASVRNDSKELRALALSFLGATNVGKAIDRQFDYAMILAQSELDLQRVQEARIRIWEMMTDCPRSWTMSPGRLEQDKLPSENTDDLLAELFPVDSASVAKANADVFSSGLSALQKLRRYERSAWAKRKHAISRMINPATLL